MARNLPNGTYPARRNVCYAACPGHDKANDKKSARVKVLETVGEAIEKRR